MLVTTVSVTFPQSQGAIALKAFMWLKKWLCKSPLFHFHVKALAAEAAAAVKAFWQTLKQLRWEEQLPPTSAPVVNVINIHFG